MVMDEDAILRNVSDSMHMLLLAGESVKCQKTNFNNFLSRMKLLKPALDYLREVKIPLPKSALSSFQYLDTVLQKVKDIVEGCGAKRSKIYLVYRCQQTVLRLQELAAETCHALDLIPMSSLHISSHTRSQVERCNQELRRLKFSVDTRDFQLAEEINGVLKDFSRSYVNPAKLKKVLDQMDLQSKESLSKERDALEKEREQINATGEEVVINQLIALLNLIMEDASGDGQESMEQEIPIPADFRCPLSQQLMSDPVIVASGQTYERAYIQQWLDQGNKTCPKTQQILSHTNLIPNYTVKALIANWCEMNNVPLPESPKLDAVGVLLKTSEPLISQQGEANQPLSPISNDREEKMQINSVPVSRSASEMNGDQEQAANGSVDETGIGYYFARIQMSSGAGKGTSTLSGSDSGRAHYSGELFGEVPDGSEEKSPRLLYRTRKERSRIKLGHNEKLFDIIGNDESKETKIRALVEDLESTSVDSQRKAAAELRLFAKNNAEDRIRIANAGAIKSLVTLLSSTDQEVQENSVTALLNLSLNDGNKHEIVESGAIAPLINVLTVGSAEARQNAAATLFSLSVKQEYTTLIGASGAILPLVELLKTGTPRGKKDAATALFNLSICHDNKAKVVKAGAVKPLVDLICDPRLGMVDKAVAVVANLSTTAEGRHAIGEDGGIPALVEVVEAGSQRGKENAAAALLMLCSNNPRYRAMVFNEGVTPMLHILSQTGTARGKEKASALLRIFREQRNGSRPPQERHANPHY